MDPCSPPGDDSDWHPIDSAVAPILSPRLDDAAARSADLPSATAPISVFVLLAQCIASLQNLPDFLSAPTSLLEDSRHQAALALIGSLDANDPSSFATEFPIVPSRRMPTVIAAAKQRFTLLISARSSWGGRCSTGGRPTGGSAVQSHASARAAPSRRWSPTQGPPGGAPSPTDGVDRAADSSPIATGSRTRQGGPRSRS